MILLDGGANVCCIRGADADLVFNAERLEKPISVEGVHGTPEDSKVKLDGFGSICLCGVYIPVFISQHLTQNIVSDGVLVEQGFKVRKEKGKVQIQPPGKATTWRDLHLDSDGRAYLGEDMITRPVPVQVKDLRLGMASRELWHARLGHRAYSYLDAMSRFPQYAEAGFKVEPSSRRGPDTCDTCLLAKSTKCHFHPPRSRAEEPGRLWYTDVAGGGQRTPSVVHGHIYRTVFVESTTQLKIVLFNEKKNDRATLANTEFWTERVLPLFRKDADTAAHLVYLAHDNGEMVSDRVQKLLAGARVVSRHTCPYTPEQNGMAERANRYLDEGAATMLAAARLPEAFWAEASRHFCLIANITPWKKEGSFEIDSYQRLHGRPFAYHLLRVWGSKCFVYDQLRDASNLSPRAIRGIYVGLAHNQITSLSWTHRVYIPTQNRFVHSGQVQFLEKLIRTPEMILPPSYAIDREREEYDVDVYDSKLRGSVHMDPEDGIHYSVRRVFERDGLALVERLPWPESKASRLEVIHLRDVLGMMHLQETAAEAEVAYREGGDEPGSLPDNRGMQPEPGGIAPGCKRTRRLPSNPKQEHAAEAQGPGLVESGADQATPTDSFPERRAGERTVSGGGHAMADTGAESTREGRRSVDDTPRRRSARVKEREIPRAHLLSAESFAEAQAQRIVDWSLSKNHSLTPHLNTPHIFSLSPNEEPNSHSEVERHPRKDEWVLGEIRERDSVYEAECLKIVNRSEVPEGRKILRLRWVYKIKRNDKGEPVLYKCRIVVMGNEATEGVDYYETYAPVCKISSLRLVIALIIHFGLKPCQVDVHTAYLHADIKEDIYVSAMPGYPLPPGKVYKLLKSLYGLPQAGRNWNEMLDAFLRSLGFRPLLEDPCVYVLIENGRIVAIFAVYVDDFIIGSDSDSREK